MSDLWYADEEDTHNDWMYYDEDYSEDLRKDAEDREKARLDARDVITGQW